MKIIEKLKTYATGRRVLWLFGITTGVYLAMLLYTIPSVLESAPGMKLFDMSPGGYSYETATNLLDAIGPTGREKYLQRQLPIDFIYPGLFAVTYTLMLLWLFGKRMDPKSKIFLLVLVPAAAGLFDYIENIGILSMLISYPALSLGLGSIYQPILHTQKRHDDCILHLAYLWLVHVRTKAKAHTNDVRSGLLICGNPDEEGNTLYEKNDFFYTHSLSVRSAWRVLSLPLIAPISFW